jgi:uncharacterized cupin superfamily protein
MTLRRVHLEKVRAFDYEFGSRDRAQRRLSVDRPHYPDGGAGLPFSGRHRHVFQEEILIVMGRQGTLLHNDEHIAVASGDCFCYRPDDPDFHSFENTGTTDLVIWRSAIGSRTRSVCILTKV